VSHRKEIKFNLSTRQQVRNKGEVYLCVSIMSSKVCRYIRVTESRRMTCARHVACIKETRNSFKILVSKHPEKKHLEG